MWVLVFVLLCFWTGFGLAYDMPVINQNGQVGGLHLPTARTLEAGTAYAGFGRSEFDTYGFIGMQPIDDLRLTIRQTQDKFGFTHPGLDAQIQLLDEDVWQPAMALGFTHLVGQGRYAGEYLAFSKLVGNVDVTVGVGWGRYGNKSAFRNPLGLENAARDNGTGADGPRAWFRGSRMGVFASAAYQTPWKNLQLLAEFDRDPYVQELYAQSRLGADKLTRRAPVNVGARVQLIEGLALTGGINSASQAQLYITYAVNLQHENNDTLQFGYESRLRPAPIRDDSQHLPPVEQIPSLAWKDGVALEKLHQPEPDRIAAQYLAHGTKPYAASLGRAAYAISDNTGNDVVAITLVPERDGLVGDTYTLLRRDVVRHTQFRGSADEIRQSATITPTLVDDAPLLSSSKYARFRLFSAQRFDLGPYEYGNFLLSRQRWQWGGSYQLLRNVTVGMTGNFRAGDNYPDIPPGPKPARSRVNAYMRRNAALENLYANGMKTVAPGWHTRVTGGLLEEMYRGVSGEVLYQPLMSRWAVGAEGNWLQQRSPGDDFEKLHYITTPAVISFYYEVMPKNLTVILRAQQFLARDKGGTLEFQHHFLRGARLGFAMNWSDRRDFGGLEDRGHLDARMTLNIPLQYEFLGVPMENRMAVDAGAVARDSGQMVSLPVRLWDATRPIAYGPILSSWQDFLND